MKDEIQILNRTLRWTKEGITYEADQRHAEIVIKEMNMKKANAVSTPTVPEPSEEANLRLRSADMTKDEASRFRELFARVNCVSLDQPDLQFAAKASQHISLFGRKKHANHSPSRPGWAGNKITRKSTNGGAMFLGKRLVKSWCSWCCRAARPSSTACSKEQPRPRGSSPWWRILAKRS